MAGSPRDKRTNASIHSEQSNKGERQRPLFRGLFLPFSRDHSALLLSCAAQLQMVIFDRARWELELESACLKRERMKEKRSDEGQDKAVSSSSLSLSSALPLSLISAQ